MSTATAPLRVGIAGLGRLGRRHGENLALHTPDCVLTAACSPVEAERAFAGTKLGVRNTYSEFNAFLRDPDVDAIVLVTPTSMHADQAIAALQAGKHVFIEKPLALDVADCLRVEAAASARPDLIAMVGFVRRFDPSHARAFDSVQQGDIGRPFLVRSQTCDRLDPDGAFLAFAPTSGGIFMDCSVHDIDLARWMLGNPKAKRAFASGTIAAHQDLAAMGDVDNGMAIVEFEGGARAVFYASRTFLHGHEQHTEIIGTQGNLLIGQGAPRDHIVRSDVQGVRHQATADFFERFSDAFRHELAAFVDACRTGAISPLSLQDATEATRIARAITASLHHGQPQDIER
ncbi:MAG TPA: oxidoreductase [Achromobacter sp.]|nr:oxidoreductase [Achromobacter sp.]